MQGVESSILVAHAGKEQGLVERVLRRSSGGEFLRLLAAASPRVGIGKLAPNLSTWPEASMEVCFEDPDRLVSSPLA
jgi:hypothetical protein